MKQIHHIKATQGLGWVPITPLMAELPIRKGHLYIFTDGTHFAMGDSDSLVSIKGYRYFEATHMALIAKPDTLPTEVDDSCICTVEQEQANRKELKCKDCIVRQYPACSKGIPCCCCNAADKSTCNSKQHCPRKEVQP